jgi:streptogramin lyase
MNSSQGVKATLLVLLALALLPAAAAAAPKVDGEFIVSSLDANSKLVEGPDHNIWVTLSGATNEVAQIDPKTGEVKEFDLGQLNGVSGIVAAGEKLWVTEAAGVTSFDPADPEVSKQTTTIDVIGSDHSIVAGPDDNLWVATNEALVRIPPANPADFKVINEIAELSPRDIDVAGPMLVVADFGAQGRLLEATPAKAANKELTEIKLKGSTQGVAGAPNGQVAFSVPGASTEAFGFLTPFTEPKYIDAPTTDPFGVAFGPDGAFWIAQAFGTGSLAPGTLSRLDVNGNVTKLTGFANTAEPRQIASGPGGTLWVTLPSNESDDKVARVTGVEKPRVEEEEIAAPETRIDKRPRPTVRTRGKRAAVRLGFSSPNAGASFECRLVRVAKGARTPPFAACSSPRAYRLLPGRYRFEVRATLKGAVDKSPATAAFRVVRVVRHRHR